MNKNLNALGNSNSGNSHLETEIRFGRFTGSKFTPGVTETQFAQIIKYFTTVGWKKTHVIDKVVSRTISRTKSARKIGNKYQLKEKLTTINNPKIGYRLAKSKEVSLNNATIFNKANRTSEYAVTRDRTTFVHENLQMDLTYLPETKTFQVELEFRGRKGVSDVVFAVSSIINASYLYKTLTGSLKFAGPLPSTLTKQAFDRKALTKNNYSVTDKADGERYLLYINVYGVFSFVTRKLEFIPLPGFPPRPDFADTILDGEFVNNTFYAFDALFTKGKDVRGGTLTKRLDTVFDILMGLRLQFLRMKTFFVEKGGKVYEYPGNKLTAFKSVYEAAKFVWANKSQLQYKLDGLIFTPLESPYFNPYILKWKDDNTIDFYFETHGSKTKLFLAGNVNGKYGMIPFEGTDGKGTIGAVKNLIFEDQGLSSDLRKGTIETPTSNKNRPTKGVAEFRFDGGTFVMIKFRPDKEFPNGVAASNQAWEAIRNPLTIEQLGRGPLLLRDYHSEIKSKLIMKYTKGKVVLDLGSGKGEDIGKYTKAGAKQVVGIDLVAVKYNHPNSMSFYKVNSPIYNVRNLVKNKAGLFDVININFAIHYFFENKKLFESLLMNIQKNLKPGGYLIGTTLDGRKLYEWLHSKQKVSTNTVNLVKQYQNKNSFNKLKLLGQKVEVLVKGTKYFNRPIAEYLVNFQKFLEIMDKWGFSLVETKTFEEMCGDSVWCSKLSNSEKEYSFKNIYFVLQKKV